MSEPRSIEETEREPMSKAEEVIALRAERDSLLTRVQQLSALLADRDLYAAESRIESLVGEREELREALAEIDQRAMAAGGGTGWGPLANIHDIIAAVLSSRETTDSPTCPTCGSSDPARSSAMQSADDVDNYCTDPFHTADRSEP